MDYTQIFTSDSWTQKRMKYQGQTRTVYLCKKVLKVDETELKCEYICRQDQPTKAVHICTFNNLFRYYKKKYASTPIQLMFFSIMVRANISFSAATSEQMFTFIHSLIKIGQDSVLSVIPSNIKFTIPPASKFFPEISRQTLAKKFNSAAQSMKESTIDVLKQFKNVCIAIDAGIINGIPILDITLVHPFARVKPLLYRAFRNFSGKTEEYIDKVKDVISELASKGICITSIVGDNLIAQKTAFDGGQNSMQFNNIGSIFAIPMWFSCICHTLSLMLDDVIEEIPFLSELNNSLQIMTKIFRSKPVSSSLQIVCPKFCETRWANEYNIIIWILKHYKIIENVFSNPPPSIHKYLKQISNFPTLFYECIPDYINFLTPVRDLITVLEGDKTPACYVYPIIAKFIERISANSPQQKKEYKEYSAILLKNLTSRIDNHYNYFLLRVLFYLTPLGREDARKTIYASFIQEQDTIHGEPKEDITITNTSIIVDDLIKKFNPTSLRFAKMANAFQNLKSDDDNDDALNTDSDDDDIPIYENENDRAFDDDVDISNTLIYNQCITQIAERYFYSLSNNQIEVTQYGLLIATAYNSWIIDPLPQDLASWYVRGPYQFWNAAKKDSKLGEFAEFVLRLLPTVASEATVERKLWRQRVVTPSDSFSLSEETQINRVIVADEINS